MASSDDEHSENESIKSDKSNSLTENYYKCCAKKTCTIQVCINCEGIFHGSCVKKKNIKVLSKRHIECCDKIPDKQKKMNREEILELKIEYMSKLLAECQEKNEVLKENNSLLKENNRLLLLQLNSINKKSETKNISEYANIVKSGCQNDINNKIVPKILVQTSDRSSERPNKHNLSVDQRTQLGNKQTTRNPTHKQDIPMAVEIKNDNNKAEKGDDFIQVRRKKYHKRLGTATMSEEVIKTGFSGAERKHH
ncbi:uncharacterized protein LOC123676437 [Harmonia axyridis]|uniref:uncharacterized protein LOC123676437 n=1 Tax=Harmonia axyridis TaxID=115357 RepID=UPI001E27883D|nr:uncharacterized protein LOC123676437 [Harmonia axyridis]